MKRSITLSALALAIALPTFAGAQTAPGTAQYAANLGVNAEQFTLSELVALDKALEDNNRTGANFILSQAGSDVNYDQLQAGQISDPNAAPLVTRASSTSSTSTAGKSQIAATIGVDPADFTLNELVGLKSAVDTNDEQKIRAILTKAGVERNALSIM
ncbi:hypothetical protein [Meridianimarinicoccus aquatilis]|uniref:DUF4142 domain-containing protein n=1 Tax=Meridianimarinicoccus aquatilis TaxID=2552766 RepID=A0A4R6AVS8_9RHOB|nr:hypothetical protein [Fluviibacterium aquatile]QIE42741.1 hypothetical protein G5B39_12910 [Rhodobacteraceae bacterium SC52]TDL86103.1 hypothetical protein E2L05_14100 [Fluviibacterium aquatile]